MGFPSDSLVKNLLANAGDARVMGSSPQSGRDPGGLKENPLQYSCLEHSKDRETGQAIVHWAAKSWMQLNTTPPPFPFFFKYSSILR